MMMMRRLLAALMALGLAGCATTDPHQAAGIDYRFPRTDAKVTLDLDVTQCIDSSTHSDQVKFSSSLKIDPVASAQDQIYHLAGKDLLTATTKRSITVDVDANGVISSVNSTATDQTTAILGSVIKLAATVAAAAGNGQTINVFVCKPATRSYVTLVNTIQTEISAKVIALAAAKDQASQAAAQKEIDNLATRLAAYKAKLHTETTAVFTINRAGVSAGTIDADNGTHDLGTPLVFDPVPLSLLFDTFESGPGAANPPNNPDVSREKQQYILTRAFFVRGRAVSAIGGDMARAPDACKQYMSVPAGKTITIVLVPAGRGYGPLDATNPAVKNGRMTATVVASQLDDPANVCLSAGFGENRTISLKFDSYGRTTEFTYAPDSRAANIAAGLAGAAPDAVTTVTSITGHSLAQDKKELDELQTHQSLVTARACEQAMDAGATSCPKN